MRKILINVWLAVSIIQSQGANSTKLAAVNIGTKESSSADQPIGSETPEQRASRTAWWREARFGMFIHWDMSSLAGTEISWSRKGSKPLDIYGDPAGYVEDPVYDQLYQKFNPTNFDAKAWVRLAKLAGMKYLVFTAKHHGGFCMWDTQFTDYSITHTPFKRDVLKELADACHAAGLRFGIYYSPRDWHQPDYGIGDNAKYVSYMNGQLGELLTNYGQVDVLWFDSYGRGDPLNFWHIPETWSLIKRLQPQVMINNRLAALRVANNPPLSRGDFDTPEQRLGQYRDDRIWESCMTVVNAPHGGWSYRTDGVVKPLADCIRLLVSCAAGDGNLLLDVGPDATGVIPPDQSARLLEMGKWLEQNGESIYGTRGGPFKPGEYGGTTRKGNTIYVHIFKWPAGALSLPPVAAKLVRAHLLSGGRLDARQTEDGLEISVPEADRQNADTVVALEFAADIMKLPAVNVSAGNAPESLSKNLAGQAPHSANPILPGYFADPSILQYQGHEYIYATIDPWGGDTVGCWEAEDFKNWTYRVLNWPTKSACTSPTSKPNMVWAPSVVRAPNGKFFMYVSVGSEVWVGTADAPLGPWHDAHGGLPLVPGDFKPGYHMIDQEAFVDADGQSYLYWGSGWNWVNGKCWAVKLKPDMVSFDGQVRDVTPTHYFEAPFMLKHGGHYYLMDSYGKTIEDTYQVRYAIGNSPLGPFTEATNSPILVTDRARNILSPGHHAVFQREGRYYILYHRHSIPFNPDFIGRQVCVDEMRFTSDGLIAKVIPTHEGPPLVQGRRAGAINLADPVTGTRASASSQRNPYTGPEKVLDDNYATLWAADPAKTNAWLQLDLGAIKPFSEQTLRFEYAWKPYRLFLEVSDDAVHWQRIADYADHPAQGSPFLIQAAGQARYLRLVFPQNNPGTDAALFEWGVE